MAARAKKQVASYSKSKEAFYRSYMDDYLEEEIMESYFNHVTSIQNSVSPHDILTNEQEIFHFAQKFMQLRSYENLTTEMINEFIAYKMAEQESLSYRIYADLAFGPYNFYDDEWIAFSVIVYGSVSGSDNHQFSSNTDHLRWSFSRWTKGKHVAMAWRYHDDMPKGDWTPPRNFHNMFRLNVSFCLLLVK